MCAKIHIRKERKILIPGFKLRHWRFINNKLIKMLMMIAQSYGSTGRSLLNCSAEVRCLRKKMNKFQICISAKFKAADSNKGYLSYID
jgi:hypothetical protein